MPDYLPLRVRIKLLLRSVLPAALFEKVTSVWVRTGARLVGDQAVVSRYLEQFLSEFPRQVQAGPFKGMHYVDSSVGSSYFHKLVGSYEAILHPYIRSLAGKDFDTVLDIGCAEGYYLAGFGSMFKKAHLIGFEIEEEGRRLSSELCQKNDLANQLDLYGEATSDTVAPLLTPKTLLICDCEGGEMDILNPDARPEFSIVDTAIIELHDFIRPGIKETLTERFEKTHSISIIQFALPNPKDFPYLALIKSEKDLYELRRERGWQEQEWMILEKRPVQDNSPAVFS